MTEKRDPKKTSFTLGRDLRPKHANKIPRPKVGVSLVVQPNAKATAKRLITMLKERIANDRSALTDELKLGEGNSDPIKVQPELKNVSSPRPSVCALATEI